MILYWPGLSGGFFFDDALNILEPASIQIKEFSIDSIRELMNGGQAGPLGRPLSVLSFAVNYYFSGFDPFAFKLTNVIIHCVNSVLVMFLAFRFVRAACPQNPEGRAWFLAAAMAALWALHPIQLTSVLYVVQRMTSLASLFMLVALNLHVWARQRPRIDRKGLVAIALGWLLFFPLSIFCKESSLVFPVFVAAYELVLQRHLSGRLDRPAVWFLRATLVSGTLGLIYLFSPVHGLLHGFDSRSFSFTQRLLTESRIIWEYIRLIVLPWLPGFSLYHDDFSVSTGLLSPPTTLLSIVALSVLVVVAWLGRVRWPVLSFSIFWFFAGHCLESTILPLELMHEHRNYLSSLGVMFLIASPAFAVRVGTDTKKTLTYAVLLSFALYTALVGYLRSELYGDEFRRTQIEAQYHPLSPRTQYAAGALIVNRAGQERTSLSRDLANKHFEKATALDPSFKYGLIGVLQNDCLSSGEVNTDSYEELARRINESGWERSDRSIMHSISELSNAKTLCLARQQVDNLFAAAMSNTTIPDYDRAVVLSDYAAYLWIGQEDLAAALVVLREATTINPGYVLNQLNLLQLLRQIGDREGAWQLFATLQRMNLNKADRGFLEQVGKDMASESN